MRPPEDEDLPYVDSDEEEDFPYIHADGTSSYYYHFNNIYGFTYEAKGLIPGVVRPEDEERMSKINVKNLTTQKFEPIPLGWLATDITEVHGINEEDLYRALREWRGGKPVDRDSSDDQGPVQPQKLVGGGMEDEEFDDEGPLPQKKSILGKTDKAAMDEDLYIFESSPSGSDYSETRRAQRRRLAPRAASSEDESSSEDEVEESSVPAGKKRGDKRSKGKEKAKPASEGDDEDEGEKASRKAKKKGSYSRAEIEEIRMFGEEINGRIEAFAASMGRSIHSILVKAGLKVVNARQDNLSNLYKQVYALDHKKPKNGTYLSFILLLCTD